jgi:MoaA/NifB/PqqE/SkfB family radical SAM enzyme
MDEFIIPNELRFAVTRKCDGLCRHCYNHSGGFKDELSSADFISILNEVYSLNPSLDRITLTGGEPLLEKEKVLQISRFARSLNIRVRLVTRGWELNRQLCVELKESGVTRLQIGLDSSGNTGYLDNHSCGWDTVHSWLRGDPEGFKKTIHAIRLVVECGISVSIRYSLCKSNVQDVIETYHLVSSMGVSKFKFRI